MSEPNGSNLFDDGDEGEDASADSASQGSESGDAGKDPKSTDKRISDLQSAKDKETARANKLQKQLDAIAAASKGDDVEAPKAPPAGGTDSAILDMARMFALSANPKLAEYGLTAEDLSGDTPSAIAASAAGLVARYEKLETQIRNKVLAENGMAPEIESGAPPAQPRDFSKMSKEDFQKVMDAALNKTR